MPEETYAEIDARIAELYPPEGTPMLTSRHTKRIVIEVDCGNGWRVRGKAWARPIAAVDRARQYAEREPHYKWRVRENGAGVIWGPT